MAYCVINNINKDSFKDMTNIDTLQLCNNNISKIHKDMFKYNPKIRTLDLSYNKIQHLHSELFITLLNIKIIKLESNMLVEISEDIFKNNRQLEEIDLSNNKIVFLANIFNNLNNLKTLSLNNNPWKCDCSLTDLQNYSSSSSAVTTMPSCSNPVFLQNMTWDILNLKDICLNEPKVDIVPNNNFTIDSDAVLVCVSKIYNSSWEHEGRLIDNTTGKYSLKKIKEMDEMKTWLFLTIHNMQKDDEGKYR